MGFIWIEYLSAYLHICTQHSRPHPSSRSLDQTSLPHLALCSVRENSPRPECLYPQGVHGPPHALERISSHLGAFHVMCRTSSTEWTSSPHVHKLQCTHLPQGGSADTQGALDMTTPLMCLHDTPLYASSSQTSGRILAKSKCVITSPRQHPHHAGHLCMWVPLFSPLPACFRRQCTVLSQVWTYDTMEGRNIPCSIAHIFPQLRDLCL